MISARVIFSIMVTLGTTHLYLMRMNMSEALVAMVTSAGNGSSTNGSTPSYDTGCSIDTLPSELYSAVHNPIRLKSSVAPTFDWDSNIQGLILSAFFYGYMFLQFPGGRLADKYGGKLVFGSSVFFNSVLSMLIPIAAECHYGVLVTARFIQGFCSGAAFPAMHAMMARWVPHDQLSFSYTIFGSGCYLGTLLGTVLTGFISDSDTLGGWPTSFYMFGASGFVWSILWYLLVYSDPGVHPRISNEERRHILETRTLTKEAQSVAIPWWSVLSSGPIWAAYFTMFTLTVTANFFAVDFPFYLKNILRIPTAENGIDSATPSLVAAAVSILSGVLADAMIHRNVASVTKTRKLFNTMGSILPAIVICLVAFWPCDKHVVLPLFWASTVLAALCSAGVYVCFIAMAPQFVGTIYGIGNLLAMSSGFIVPQIVGFVTTGAANTVTTWSWIIFVTQGITVLAAIVFAIWGSADLQPWAISPRSDDIDELIT